MSDVTNDSEQSPDVPRRRVLVGAVGIATVAALSGLGGAPSVAQRHLPEFWPSHPGQYLFVLYFGALLLAIVSVVLLVTASSGLGRLIGAGAAFLTLVGNALSALVGGSDDYREARVLAMFLLAFVLVMWMAPAERDEEDGPTA